ncbi:MAG: hypothetical protein ACK5PB_01015 [Pirellula sp.]|jgi:hypothetical protein
MTLVQAWEAMAQHSIWAVLITVAFFTAKGLLWLAVPFLIVRFRRLVSRRDQTAGLQAER